MFHEFDNSRLGQPAQRQHWMALLARAPRNLLEQHIAPHLRHSPQWLRQPETGLMMVQARAGGTGERFNVGEMTVTRCALRLAETGASAAVGVAYITGRDHRRAQLAAAADALLQDARWHEALARTLLESIRQHLQELQTQRRQKAVSTRVDFLTLARESGADDETDAA